MSGESDTPDEHSRVKKGSERNIGLNLGLSDVLCKVKSQKTRCSK